ncbi:MAG TPA: hypothetical protein DIT31_05390 [Methylophaga sp.]|jgi:abortive infection alpha-like protein|nr:DUF4393 domain-containing protein [Alcanivorax sp.]HCN99715.1 hypothetical protein [Methylophaga sp.]|tara:strand:- start:1391 stop:2215 length:825 start_codon:yes stop_codon:yes gene_type:complete
MSESNDKESTVEGTINAVSGLVEKVPVYEDAIRPLAKETGKALGTVGKTVNAALMPIRGLVWGMEQIEEFVQTKVTKKLENVPPENIQTPDPAVAGPAIESLRFTGHKESLSDLYANLLATSMDSTTAKTAHPGFVEIIRNLSGDEAKILSHLVKVQVVPLVDIRRESTEGKGGVVVSSYVSTVGHDSGCEHRDLVSTYLKNLERLGLIDIPRDKHLVKEGVYDRILNDPPVKKIEEQLNALEKHQAKFEKYYATPSALGELFISACVNSRDKT